MVQSRAAPHTRRDCAVTEDRTERIWDTMKRYVSGVAASVVVAFATAFVWHLVLFRKLYEELGAIGRIEPNVPLGFTATLALSLTLSYLYPKVMPRADNPIRDGAGFGITIGILNVIFWVLKFAATQPLASIPVFVAVESAFELIQLAFIGITLGLVYRGRPIVSVRH
jgi:hypothetical protein